MKGLQAFTFIGPLMGSGEVRVTAETWSDNDRLWVTNIINTIGKKLDNGITQAELLSVIESSGNLDLESKKYV